MLSRSINMFNTSRHVALDVETTGLSPRSGHRIIEIGAVVIDEGYLTSEFSSLIRIDRKIPRQAQCIHGISDEILAGEQEAEEVLPQLYDFLGGSVIIAHNARFDMAFLRQEFKRIALKFSNEAVCTLKMSKKMYPGLPNYRLDTVYRHLFGEVGQDINRHRALDDARMAARIWMEMVKR